MWVVKFPSFFFACLFIFELSISISNVEDKNICVHVFTPLCNFFSEHEKSITFITLITLSSMLCTYYIPNAYLMTNSKIRGPFLSWPDSQSFQSQLSHFYIPTWTSDHYQQPDPDGATFCVLSKDCIVTLGSFITCLNFQQTL